MKGWDMTGWILLKEDQIVMKSETVLKVFPVPSRLSEIVLVKEFF